MRARLILGTVALVVLTPQAASALCMTQPFDEVVRSSDSVLVATVAEAAPEGDRLTGIIVRLDVEQVLKGSAEDGRSVSISSCGPVISGAMAASMAQGMIGSRGLFLLSRLGDGTSSRYPFPTTPQGMTLDEKIAEARRVLGLPANPSFHDPSGTTPRWPWALAGLLVVAIALLIAGVALVRRRAQHR